VQYASWDDVNVLAHGLLQLGHGLKDHVDKTKGQMRDITAKLKSFDGTVAELSKLTRHLQEEGDALREKAKQLGHREKQVLNTSAEPQALAEDMRTERESTQDRVGRLERKVDILLRDAGSNEDRNRSTTDAHTLQWMMETQSRRIDDLVERVRQQQDKLDKQNVRLQALQAEVKQRRLKSVVTRKVEDFSVDGMLERASPSNELPSDCHELFLRGEKQSGVYTIKPHDAKPFNVFCEMTSEHGWTVIQKREDGSLDFNRLWSDYQNGFGSLRGEFWLGLEKMLSISKQRPHVLQIELSDWRGETQSVSYSFQLDGEESNYALHVQPTTPSNLESALTTGPDGLPFSTADRDQDLKEDANCALQLSGGWWFSNCGHSNLNGRYQSGPTLAQRHHRKQVVFWKTWHGRYYPLKTTAMKITPAIKS
ncbi:angiopoietin-related protein 4-like, partial [Clupea harengus]|uniref:Angiopoietin-related protein 4-like n=1 Tax=Clupea harengus TaxID=7950 RepID=A0A8M1KL83_CLUHA